MGLFTAPGWTLLTRDVVRAEFGGEGAGHAGDRMFAGGVVHHERLYLLARVRADEDHRAAAARDEVRGGGHDVETAELEDRVRGRLLQPVQVTGVALPQKYVAAFGLHECGGVLEVRRGGGVVGHCGQWAGEIGPTMSVPSRAGRTAWARPWPRATPVMKATFPCSRAVATSPRRWTCDE